MMNYKPLSEEKIVFKKGEVKNDNINILIHKSGLAKSKAHSMDLKELNINSHLQYIRYLSDTYPLEADITLNKNADSLTKRLKAIQEYHLYSNQTMLK